LARLDFNSNSNGIVSYLALSGDDSILYAGGYFYTIGGQSRNGVAAINTSTGLALDFNPSFANSLISTLSLSFDNQTLFTGYQGGSVMVNSQIRNHIAHILPNGTLDPDFTPDVEGGFGINTMIMSPDGKTLYLGGTFTTINGNPRTALAAVDASSGSLISGFNNNIADNVNSSQLSVNSMSLSNDGSTLYIGCKFNK
jgi:hypothetical protein